MPINGESPVPLGRSNTGAAFVLGRSGPDALTILQQGQRMREQADAKARQIWAKADEAKAKEFNDRTKYKISGSHYFGSGLQKQVYAPLIPKLAEVYQEQGLDSFGRKLKAQPILDQADSETAMADAKTKYLDGRIGEFQKSGDLYDAGYATKQLAAALRDGERERLPSEFDEEAWYTNLLADPVLYKEPAVVSEALKKLVPVISQKVSEAGQLGGQHSSNSAKGQLVAMDGGKVLLNADGSPVLDLDGGAAEFLDQGVVKILADKREADYSKALEENARARQADPTIPALPRMTRKGHLKNMFGPAVAYSETHDEGLNARIPQPRATKASADEVVIRPAVSRYTSYSSLQPGAAPSAVHYAAVGKSYGSKSKPYAEVVANAADLQIIGRDGQPTRANTGNANGTVPVRLLSRDYVLYDNGKRLGSKAPFATDSEALQYALNYVKNHPNASKLELRVEGRGVTVDKVRTAGDGLGATSRPVIGTSANGTPLYDSGTTESIADVTVPITQAIDAQLERMTGKSPRIPSLEERQLIDAVRSRGGSLQTPYSTAKARPTPDGGPLARRASMPAPPPPAAAANPYGFKFKTTKK